MSDIKVDEFIDPSLLESSSPSSDDSSSAGDSDASSDSGDDYDASSDSDESSEAASPDCEYTVLICMRCIAEAHLCFAVPSWLK